VKKVFKYIVRIVVGTGIVIILLGLIGYLVLLIPPIQQKALVIAENRINNVLTGTISIGRISTNFISSMDVYDVILKDTITGTDSIRVSHARARFYLPMLLAHKLMFSRIVVDKAIASFSIRSDTTIALPMLPVPEILNAPPGDGPPLKVQISTISVKKITAFFTDSVFGQNAFIENSRATVHIPAVDSITVKTLIRKGRYTSVWWNGTIRTIDGDVTFFPHKLSINRVLVKADHSRLTGKGDVPFNPMKGMWNLSASVSSDISAIPALFNAVPGCGRKGSLKGDLSWVGTFGQPRLDADINGIGLTVQDISADTLTVHARYDTTGRINARVAVTTPFGQAEVKGGINLSSLFTAPTPGGYSGELTFNRLSLTDIPHLKEKLPPQFEGMLVSGMTTLAASGTTIPDTAEIAVIASDLPFIRKTAAVTARVNGDAWESAVTLDGNTISASGTQADFKAFTGTVRAAISKPSTFSRIVLKDPVRGALTSDISFHISQNVFSASGAILSRNMTWRDAHLDSLSATFTYSDSEQKLEHLHLIGHAVLDTLLHPFNIDSIAGSIDFSCTGSGQLLAPDLSLRVNSGQLAYKQFTVDSLFVTGSTRALDTLSIDNCTIVKRNGNVAVTASGLYFPGGRNGRVYVDFKDISRKRWKSTGRCSVNGTFRPDSCDASFSVTPLSLASVSSFLPLDSVIYGTMQASGTVSGAYMNPQVYMNAVVGDIGYDRFNVASLQIDATVSDSLAEVQAELLPSSPCAPIRARAVIPLHPADSWKLDTSGTRSFRADLYGKNILIGPVLRQIDSAFIADGNLSLSLSTTFNEGQFPLSGSVSLDYGNIFSDKPPFTAAGINMHTTVDGTLQNPHLAYVLEGGAFTFAEGGITGLHINGELTREYATISRAEVTMPDSGFLSLTGMLPLHKSDAIIDTLPNGIDFTIKRLPLTLLKPFLPGNLSLYGMVQSTGTVTLVGGTPHINGSATLRNGKVASDDIRPAIGPINAAIMFTGDSIAIAPLSAEWNKGSIKGNGYMRIRRDSLPYIHFDMSAKDCEWSSPDIYFAVLDKASVNIRTNGNEYTIGGKVAAGPTRYIQNLQIGTIIETVKKQSSKSLAVAPNPLLEKINLDVMIDLQENVTVDMNLGYLTIDGECTLVGTMAQPSYIGEFSITEGYVLYLDRQFTINKATLYNFSPHRFNPQIDLEAQADVVSINGDQMENFTILLTLTGELNNAILKLREETGELNELEIVSVLTFGQRLSGMSGDIKDRLKTFISQSLLGFGTRKLEQFLGIERIDFKGELFADGGESNGQLTIAKRVTPRLMVLYETDIDNLNKPKISALYRITNNIFISGESDADGESGVDLIFKFSR
jgi:hypothetical protein